MRAIEILTSPKHETTLRYLLPGDELLERTWGANWHYDAEGKPVDREGRSISEDGSGPHHVEPHDLDMMLGMFGEEIGQRFDAWIRGHGIDPDEHRPKPAPTAALEPAEPQAVEGKGKECQVLPLPGWIAARMGIDPEAARPPAAKRDPKMTAAPTALTNPLTTIGNAASDPAFVTRVLGALEIACNSVQNESVGTANHVVRLALVKRMLGNPSSYATTMAPAIAAAVNTSFPAYATLTAVSDADLQSSFNAVIDMFALQGV